MINNAGTCHHGIVSQYNNQTIIFDVCYHDGNNKTIAFDLNTQTGKIARREPQPKRLFSKT